METAQAYLNRFAEVYSQADGAAYADLFDSPMLYYADEGVEIAPDAAALAARIARVQAAAADMEVKGYRVELLAERPFGGNLLAVRVETNARFADGAHSDPYAEMWLLRHRPDGRLAMAAAVNPISTALFRLPVGACVGLDGEGLPVPPAELGTDRGVRRLVQAMTDSFNRGDAMAQARLMCVPNAKIGDTGSAVMTSPDAVSRRARLFFDKLADFGGAHLHQQLMFVRPFGACLLAARVEVTATLADGRACEPMQELWIIRHSDAGALRICAFVNPFSPRFVPELAPDTLGDRS